MTLNLPLHPSKRHPLTGEPIRALYVDKHGRPRYPFIGAAEDDGNDDGGDSGGDGATDDSGDDSGADGGSDDLGFPRDTPVSEMTAEQKAAYDAHKREQVRKAKREWKDATGDRTAAQVKADLAELAKLRTEKMTDGERAVETAKAEGRREASLALAPQMFDVALSHVDADRRAVLIDSIDLSKVIKEDGTIDTAKVTTLASTLAPTGKDQGGGNQYDLGGGRRNSTTSSGVSAGAEMYQSSRKQKTT